VTLSLFAWFASIVATFTYAAWAFFSNSPARYWALAVPAVVVMAVCLYGVTYGCLALALTPASDAPSALRDAFSRPLDFTAHRRGRGVGTKEGRAATQRWRTPEFADAPPVLVSAAMFKTPTRPLPVARAARVIW
jgi:hypothetical protein